MAAEINAGTAYATLTWRDKYSQGLRDFNARIEQASRKAEQDFGRIRRAADMASKVFAGFTVAGVAGMLKLAQEAADTEEAMNLFRVTFDKNTAAAEKWSKELSRTYSRNVYAARRFMADFAAVLKPGLGADKAFELSKGLTKLAYDLESFRNIPIDEVIQRLQSGMAGEIEAVRKLGMDLSEATVKRVAYTNGIAKEGQELDETQKRMARYVAMLQQSKDAENDVIRTKDSLVNRQRAVQEKFAELRVEIGQQFIPVLEKLVAQGEKVTDWISSLTDDQKMRYANLAKLAVELSAVAFVITTLATRLPAVIKGFQELLALAATAGITGASARGGLYTIAALLGFMGGNEIGKLIGPLAVPYPEGMTPDGRVIVGGMRPAPVYPTTKPSTESAFLPQGGYRVGKKVTPYVSKLPDWAKGQIVIDPKTGQRIVSFAPASPMPPKWQQPKDDKTVLPIPNIPAAQLRELREIRAGDDDKRRLAAAERNLAELRKELAAATKAARGKGPETPEAKEYFGLLKEVAQEEQRIAGLRKSIAEDARRRAKETAEEAKRREEEQARRLSERLQTERAITDERLKYNALLAQGTAGLEDDLQAAREVWRQRQRELDALAKAKAWKTPEGRLRMLQARSEVETARQAATGIQGTIREAKSARLGAQWEQIIASSDAGMARAREQARQRAAETRQRDAALLGDAQEAVQDYSNGRIELRVAEAIINDAVRRIADPALQIEAADLLNDLPAITRESGFRAREAGIRLRYTQAARPYLAAGREVPRELQLAQMYEQRGLLQERLKYAEGPAADELRQSIEDLTNPIEALNADIKRGNVEGLVRGFMAAAQPGGIRGMAGELLGRWQERAIMGPQSYVRQWLEKARGKEELVTIPGKFDAKGNPVRGTMITPGPGLYGRAEAWMRKHPDVGNALGAGATLYDISQNGDRTSGAMQGAMAGMAFGPIGAAVGGIAGAILGGQAERKRREEEANRIRQQMLKALTSINNALTPVSDYFRSAAFNLLPSGRTYGVRLNDMATAYAVTSARGG